MKLVLSFLSLYLSVFMSRSWLYFTRWKFLVVKYKYIFPYIIQVAFQEINPYSAGIDYTRTVRVKYL